MTMNRKIMIGTIFIIVLAVSLLSWYILFVFPRIHNIAVKRIIPSTTKIYDNSAVEINVTVENKGNFLETFNVTLYSNNSIIETQHFIQLKPKTANNLTFVWDTSKLPNGNYYLKAKVSIIPNEINTTDNVLVYGPIKILPRPVLYVDPSESVVQVGENFNVTVNIKNCLDLYGSEFKLEWNPEILDLVKIIEGDFLKTGGETLFYKNINETAGRCHVVITLLGDISGVNGNGTLAILMFRGKLNGESVLHLYDTNLGDSSLQAIPHTINDGLVKVCAVVFVSPTVQKVSVNEEFVVSVRIQNVVNMCGYEFRIGYAASYLEGINSSIPDVFGTSTQIIKNEINNTIGRIWIAVVSAPLTPINGNYTLCQLSFRALSAGNVSLNLYEVKIGDENAEPIPIIIKDGAVEIDPPDGSGGTVTAQSGSTVIFVDPAEVSAQVGQYFTIRVNISNVVDLYGWEFKLSWNSSLIEVVNVIEGDFLKTGGETFFYQSVNNTSGALHLTCTLLGDIPGVSGNGTLAEIIFYVKSNGESVLHLYDTNLGDSNLQPIPHTTNDGYAILSKSNAAPSKVDAAGIRHLLM
ncbi:hypothetical protein DRO54_01670 [Candidatus Bathyarchaeota archaeon]|nr:MAG: hypothetical protein DRO54_01670 [Candidatus Bathyarchaeota archaeon]